MSTGLGKRYWLAVVRKVSESLGQVQLYKDVPRAVSVQVVLALHNLVSCANDCCQHVTSMKQYK